MTAAPREIELKLLVAPEDMDALRAAPPLAASAPKTMHLHAIYYDTPEGDLAAAGAALRVRRKGNRFVQTVKIRDAGGRADAGGLRDVAEHEWEIESDRPRLELLAEDAIRAHIPAHALPRLVPTWTTEVERAEWELRADGGEIAVALDRGAVRAGDAEEAISEIEFELKSGAPASLFWLALALSRTATLRFSGESKADVGRRLLHGRAPEPVKGDPSPLPADATVDDAIAGTLGGAMAQAVANLPAVRHGDAVEAVHQLRVALRRLRAALKLFAPYVDGPEGRWLADEARDLGRALAPARDWDVFVDETLPTLGGDAADALRAAANAARNSARAEALGVVDSARFSIFLLTVGAYVESRAWRREAPKKRLAELDGPLPAVAPKLLDVAARKARKRARRLDRADDEEIHALRTAMKRLRYAVEFLGGLYKSKPMAGYLRAAEDLQDRLGAFNDAAVAEDLLARLDAPDDAKRALLRRLRARRKAARKKIPRAWDAFARREAFWS